MLISFVTVQGFPHRFAQDAIDFDSYKSRLFEDRRISVLDEQEASQHTVYVKLKISQDYKALLRQAAAPQGTIHGQKGHKRSTFHVQRSTFDVPRSTFHVRRSTFGGRSQDIGNTFGSQLEFFD